MLVKKISVFIFALFLSLLVLAKETSPAEIDTHNTAVNLKKFAEINTPTDFTKPILVTSISPAFTVGLPANISTGYQWYLVDYNPRFVRLLDQQYVPANKILGGGGVSLWQFQLQQISFAAPQVTSIIFEYRRPWELKPIKKQSVVVISQQPTKGELP